MPNTENESAWAKVIQSMDSAQDPVDLFTKWKRDLALHTAVQEAVENIEHPEIKAVRKAWESVSKSIGLDQTQELIIKDGKLTFQSSR